VALRPGIKCTVVGLDPQRTGEMVLRSSLVVRIAGWYGWLLVVLVLAFGAYTCKCLANCLTIGEENELSIRAKEIASMFAKTGQIPVREDPSGPGLNDPFISVHESGSSVSAFSGEPETQTVVPSNLRREPNSLAVPTPVRGTAHDSRFLIATAPSTFGNKEYVVEVEVSTQPIGAVFRQTAIAMVIGLVVGLAFATWGSFSSVKRALAPVREMARAVRALPVTHPDECIKDLVVLDEIKNLCGTLNELVSQLEESFEIGIGLPAGAFHSPGTRLGKRRAELSASLENTRSLMGVAEALRCFLRETERLSDVAKDLSKVSCEDTRTERLRFYLGGLAAAEVEHVCLSIETLGSDLASEARGPSDGNFLGRW
jgi:HAMP domain-containing protein